MSFSYENEKNRIVELLQEKDVPLNQCEIVADVMATADMYGVTSHGVRILDSHIQRLERGAYNVNPQFKHIKETVSFALVDGDNALGFVSADYCMNYAVEKCKETGIFHVISRNNNTLGPAFYYPLQAAKCGMIGFVCCNSPAQMAPIGGKDKLLGTNPFAVAIPVPNQDPIIIDMATSVVAKSKFKEYKEQGKKLPVGWALDKDGNPTTDPDAAMQGLVQPMAGFKGYAISMLIDILSGVISGASYLDKVGRFYSEDKNSMNVGFYFTAINPKLIIGEEYDEIITDFVKRIRESESVGNSKICLPGDDRISYMKDVVINESSSN